MSDLRAEVTAAVAAMRAASPLVHGATGSVTRAIVADGLLAAGARPMLTETVDEAPTLVAVADAFLANLGSLSSDGRAGLLPTAEVAAERSAAGPCRSNHGLLSTKPVTPSRWVISRRRSRSSHRDTINPPAEWPTTSTAAWVSCPTIRRLCSSSPS